LWFKLQEKIAELFESTKAKTIMLRNFSSEDPNFSYFSGLLGKNFPGAFLILKENKKPLLLASRFEEKNANNRMLRVHGFDKEKKLLEILKKELSGKKIGLNFSIYPVNSLKRLKKAFKTKKFFDVSKELEKAREEKTKKEIKLIKNSVSISEECLEDFPDILKKAKSEKEAALEINYCLQKNGAEELAFPTIVASGTTAASIHHAPTNKKIKKGDLVLVDFGARANCYCSDLTRMFCVGAPTEKQKELFEIVLQAKEKTQTLIKPGTVGKKVFLEVEEFLKQKGFALQHSIGHGLGIETHDFPAGFTPHSEAKLKEKMVFTVEPGIYDRFGGIRLEDDIVITSNGFKFLSKPQKEITKI
jgi:Xaa-Pro aminopeptidase